MTKDNFSSEVYEAKAGRIFMLMLVVLVLQSMLMSHTSLHFFVLSFVLACAYIASEEQTLIILFLHLHVGIFVVKHKIILFLSILMCMGTNHGAGEQHSPERLVN